VSFLCEDPVAADVRVVASASDPSLQEVKDISLVSVIGEGLSNSNEAMAQCLQVLGEHEQRCLLLSSNSLSLTIAVPQDAKMELAQKLHSALVEVD
jgi:aspartokinase